MRMHLHLPLAWGLAWTAVGFGTAGAAEPTRRAPIRDSQVVAAQGYESEERVLPGSYEVEEGATGSDIAPISAELQDAAGGAMSDGAVPAYAEGMPPGGVYPAGGYYPPPGPDDTFMYQRSPLEAGQPPPGMQPWPGISPYDHRFDQTVNRDGIWFRNIFDGPNKKYFGTELLLVSLRQANRETQRIGYPVFRTTLSANRHRDLSPMDGPLETTGLRLFAGISMPDQSGAEVSAFLTGDPDWSHLYQPGRNLLNQAIFDPIEIARVNQEGDVQGSSLLFSNAMIAQYSAQAWGAEGNIYTTPVLGHDTNILRIQYGIKYLGVKEALWIRGYDFANGVTTIESIVNSQMFGPHAGLRWDMGGEKLKLVTQGKAGVLGNFQEIHVNADGYASTQQRLDPTIPSQARLEEMFNHLSPMLEFSFHAEMPLFGYLPVVNKVPVVRDGIFRVGYTITSVFLTQRPAGTITYADPLPRIDREPLTWYMQWINLGAEWRW